MLSLRDRTALVQHCLTHENPFYRDLYGLGTDATIGTEDAWLALPPLTKDDLAKTPLSARSFIPLSELDHIRASSGTSGKPPLFSPRTQVRGLEYRLQYHDFKRPFLTFSVPLMPHWHEMVQQANGITPRVITIDPAHPEASVRIAALAGVDAVSLFAYQLRSIGEAMKAARINERIVFLEITGELCSRARYEYARATFPNATLLHSYGASEVEDVHMGMPCGPMRAEEPFAFYHPKSSHYLELIDPESDEAVPITPGAEGDLLITSYPGEPSAFPLIRYRIGDTVRIVETPCPHGEPWSFVIIGRTELDVLKVEGGIIRADEIGRVLRDHTDTVTDVFELHRFEHMTPEGPRTRLELRVQPKRPMDLDAFARTVASRLRINPDKTYADGVAAGRFFPLICTVLGPIEGRKHTRIISHV